MLGYMIVVTLIALTIVGVIGYKILVYPPLSVTKYKEEDDA